MDIVSLVRTLGGLGVVLGILGGALWLVRRFDLRLPGRAIGTRERRLELVETLAIDGRRMVALVRRDGREHLVLIAPEGHMMLENGIIPDAADLAVAIRHQAARPDIMANRNAPGQGDSGPAQDVAAPHHFAALVEIAAGSTESGIIPPQTIPVPATRSITRLCWSAATVAAGAITKRVSITLKTGVRRIVRTANGSSRAFAWVARKTWGSVRALTRAAGRAVDNAAAIAGRVARARARAQATAAVRRTARIAATAAAKAAAAAAASMTAVEAAQAAAAAAEAVGGGADRQPTRTYSATQPLSAAAANDVRPRPRGPARIATPSEPGDQQTKRARARRRRRARQETYVA